MKRSYILALSTVLVWGTMATVVKIMLEEIPSLQALSVSGFFAFAFLLVMNLFTGGIKKAKEYKWRDYLAMAGLGFLGLFMYSALYYYGIEKLTAQTACILNYLWPIMLVAFSCLLLKEKLTVKKAAALVLSFGGIVVLFLEGGTGGEGSFALGVAACVGAAVCYGLFSVLNKKADMDQNITMTVIWLTVAVCAFIMGQLTEEWVPIKGNQWLGLLWLGVMTDAAAYLMWALALKNAEDSSKVAILAYLTPFISIIVSAVVLKEKLTDNAAAALALIIGGILLQHFGERKKKA